MSERHRDDIGGILHALWFRDAAQQIALLRRTEHHDRTPQIGTQPGQLGQIIGRRSRTAFSGEVKYSPSVLANSQCSPTISSPADSICRRTSPRCCGETSRCVSSQRKRRNFDARVTRLASKGERPLEGPILKRFVANGVFHLMDNSAIVRYNKRF